MRSIDTVLESSKVILFKKNHLLSDSLKLLTVSNFTSYRIKADILNNLPKQEPRIDLEEVTVIPVPDQHEFYITLQINIFQQLHY